MDAAAGSRPRRVALKPATPPRFFPTPAEFRRWLETHHEKAPELWVGFHKRDSGLPSITWPESVDEALCFGWIDGVRKSLGATSYMIRFTPRQATSTWSTVNTRRMAELVAAGRVQRAGLDAFDKRSAAKSGTYAYEQRHSAELGPEFEGRFRANRTAWAYFQARPPWYRRTATWWVVSAKREETRQRRLAALVECSERGEPIPQLRRPESK